jgi:flagellar basal-body rod modification protein FlgD
MAISHTISTSSSSSRSTSNSQPTAADAINDLDLSSFLKLMITELQQQDPLNPLDNKDMLNQIAQIRSIGASDKLTSTLDSVLLGQNIASATNLIGADISALSDDGQSIQGVVNRISIDKGVPKLHVQNNPSIGPSSDDGNIEAGTHSYRVVWRDESGKLIGMDFSGDYALSTTGTAGLDKSIELHSLPVTSVPKYVYRTDSSGTGAYQLVDIIADGSQGTFVDNKGDGERNGQRLTEAFQRAQITQRSYDVSLKNVSAVRPPAVQSPAGG